MQAYNKLIAALIGVIVMVASNYGIDLTDETQSITDAVISIVTALSVYFVPNKEV